METLTCKFFFFLVPSHPLPSRRDGDCVAGGPVAFPSHTSRVSVTSNVLQAVVDPLYLLSLQPCRADRWTGSTPSSLLT